MGHLSRSVVVLAGTALLIAGSGAWALASSSDGTITVCVHHSGGGLYQAKQCAKHDKKLTWNTTGPAGPPGAPATRLWAVVNSAGALLRGSHATSASVVSGGYAVHFDRNVSHCSYQATLGATMAEVGEVGVGPLSGSVNGVFVFTAGSTGGQAVHGFNLAVYC